MNKVLLFTFILFSYLFSFSQKELCFQGKIGKYPISIVFESFDTSNNQVKGFYSYGKNKAKINLIGEKYKQVLELNEFVDQDTTGYWLVSIEDSIISGYWQKIDQSKSYEVNGKLSKGNLSDFNSKTEQEKSLLLSSKISGTYEINHYFVNDYFYSSENPTIELGYNGGRVTVKQLNDSTLIFSAEMICGPTYHFAIIEEAIAYKKNGYFLYSSKDEEEICEVKLYFENKGLNISSNNSMACGFGARAYLDH